MTKTRCKVGDLVILIGARLPENLGKFATVIDPIGWKMKNEFYTFEGRTWRANDTGFMWVIEGQHPFEVGYGGVGMEGESWKSKNALAFDHCLLPIRPEDLDESTDEELIKDTEKETT